MRLGLLFAALVFAGCAHDSVKPNNTPVDPLASRPTSQDIPLGPPDVPAGMDKEEIRKAIRVHLPEVRKCYEGELAKYKGEDLYGKIVIVWDVDEGGHVTTARITQNTLPKGQTAECILGSLKTWIFPGAPKNMVGRISYPFVFSSQ